MPEEIKYFICLFTLEGHRTWRMFNAPTMDKLNVELKKIKNITAKKFFEVDRMTGTITEF